MNYRFLALALLSIPLVTGCGDSKPNFTSSTPSVQGLVSPTNDGPTLVAAQPENNAAKKRKRPAKHVPPVPVLQPEAVPLMGTRPSVVLAPQVSAPVVVDPPKPTKPYVVGMKTQSKTPTELFEKGTSWAISDARVCAGFGFIPNGSAGGSKCYLVYSDGSTKPADYYTRVEAFAFVDQLIKQNAAEEQARKEKKEAKKRKNKE